MSSLNIYQITVNVMGYGTCQNLFAGYPTREEVLMILSSPFDTFTGSPGDIQIGGGGGRGGVGVPDTYDNYFYLVRQFGMPEKPLSHSLEGTILICKDDGRVVGSIQVVVIGQAHVTLEMSNGN